MIGSLGKLRIVLALLAHCGLRNPSNARLRKANKPSIRNPQSAIRNGRRGFIHTLEAILATFIVLGFVAFIMPSLREPAETGQMERLRMSERLSTLDTAGELSNYVSDSGANLSGLKDAIDLETNASYGYSLGLVSYAAETVKGNRQVSIVQGQNNITQVVASAANSSATLLPETIVWDSGGPKATSVTGTNVNLTATRVSATELEIKFTALASSGEYRYRVKKSEAYGPVPENRTVWTSTYLPSKGTLEVFANSS